MNDSKKEAAFYDPRPDPDHYIKKAKRCVLTSLDSSFKSHDFDEKDLYVVWFSKTLDNWKALISTDKVLMYDDESLYFEVTHDGLKGMTYVDRYDKVSNKAISDAYLAATNR